MGRRLPPKRKALKNRRNYDPSSATELTSQDIFYTTGTNDARKGFQSSHYRNRYDDSYITDKYFEKYDVGHRSYDSALNNDYTTSAMSYEPRSRQKHLMSPESRSDEVYNRRSPYRYDDRSRSPPRDFDSFQRDFLRKKKNAKYTKSPGKPKYYNFEDNNYERGIKLYQRQQSPYRKRDYVDLIHEEPEKDTDYENYFEETSLRGVSRLKREKQNSSDYYTNGAEIKHPWKRQKDHQVYAYQERKQKTMPITQESSLPSEVEVKSHEYPLLAFTDQQLGKNGSGQVYLPVVVVSNKSKNSKPGADVDKNKENVQVFVANLRDQQNVFNNFQDFSKLDIQKEIFKNNSEKSQEIEQKLEIHSGLQYADSVVKSLIEEALMNKSNSKANDVKESRVAQKVPFTLNSSPVTYQVNVDILTNGTSGKQVSASLADKTSHKKATDSHHDDFPVTKDYIKVNSSNQDWEKQNIYQKTAKDTERDATKNNCSNLLNTRTKYHRNEGKDNTFHKSVFKTPPVAVCHLNLEPVSKTESNHNSKGKSRAIGSGQGSRTNVKSIPAATKLSNVKEETYESNTRSPTRKLQEQTKKSNRPGSIFTSQENPPISTKPGLQSYHQEKPHEKSIPHEPYIISGKSRVPGANANSQRVDPSPIQHKSDEDLEEFTKYIFQVDIDKVQSPDNVFSKKPGASVPGKSKEGPKKSTASKVVERTKDTTKNEKRYSRLPSQAQGPIKKQRSLKSMVRSISRLGSKKAKSQDRSSVEEGHKDEKSAFVQSYEPTATQYKKEQERSPSAQSKTKSLTSVTPKEKKSRTLSRIFSRSKSKDSNSDPGSKQGQQKKKTKTSRSLLSGILRKSKSGEFKDQETKKSITQETNKPWENEPQSDQTLQNHKVLVANYINCARMCAYFFLGTTLHEEIMDILNMLF